MAESENESEIAVALHLQGPLPEVLLLDLARKCLKLYLDNADQPPSVAEVHQLWRKLSESAASGEATEKYLGAVCNAISVFLSILLRSQHGSVAGFCFTPVVWDVAYNAAHRAFDKGKTKPGLQLLETLCNLLNQDPDPLAASNLLHDAVKGLVKTVFVGGLQHNVKVACIALSCFIRRTNIVLNLPYLAATSLSEVRLSWTKTVHSYHLPNEDPHHDESSLRALILALYITISGLDARSAALKLLKLLCAGLDKIRPPRWGLELAATMFGLFVTQNPGQLADFAENVLPIILDTRQSWATFESMFQPLQPESAFDSDFDASLVLYLIVLRVGNLKGYLNQDGQLFPLHDSLTHTDELSAIADCLRQAGVPLSSQYIEPSEGRYSVYLSLFKSSNPTLRIQAYNLATASSSSCALVSPSALRYIAEGLIYLHDETDSYQRGEILSITRRLLRRLDSYLTAFDPPARLTDIFDPCDYPNNPLVFDYFSFLLELQGFLKKELSPAISYPRHILSLDTLRIFLSLTIFFRCSDKDRLITPLLNLILDPFEDVREVSAGLCKTLLTDPPDLYLQIDLWKLTRRVQLLSAKTCRHDHADAAARFYALAYSIQGPQLDSATAIQSLTQHLASTNSLPPSSTFPLHAFLLGASYQLVDANVDASNPDILTICRRVWHLVKDRLCLDSPETAEAGYQTILTGPKDLLAYSWRALRDSSLLLQAMLKSKPADLHTLREAGSLCFEQLTMLRHRGAFSAVAQTFSLCCELARSSYDHVCRDLNQLWYGWALDEIERQATRLTRRSAGLPALVNSVLSPRDPRFFHTVINDLTVRARQPVSGADDGEELQLPQVHALNCIKDIMHNSRFRAVNEAYVSQLLELGADSLTSGTWAIRNSGLMLLKACMIRLEPHGSASKVSMGHYGSQSTRMEPLKVAIGLLERANTVEQSTLGQSGHVSGEHIFAALDLVKYVGRAEEDSAYLRFLIQRQLASKIWAIRDQAARVLVDRLQFEPSFSSDFLSVWPLPEACSENGLHGSLLLYRYFLQEHYEHSPTEQMDRVLERLPHNLGLLARRLRPRSSPYTKAALVDLVNDWAAFILKEGRMASEIDIPVGCMHQVVGQTCNSYLRARGFLNQALIYILFGYEVSTLRKFVLIGEPVLEALCREMIDYPDATKYVVEAVEGVKPADGLSQWRRVDLLARIVLDSAVADVRSLAITALAETLETNSEMAEYMGKPEIAHTRLAISQLVERECTNERELWNATLRIRPFVTSRQADGPMLDQSKWGPLLTDIRDAGWDVTEFATRLSAGYALRSAAPSFPRVESPLLGRALPIFWSTVYSQLNDDDDEIRAIAGQTTSIMVGPVMRNGPLGWCALAGREEIIPNISIMYPFPRVHIDLVRTLALCHIFGVCGNLDDGCAIVRDMIVNESVASKVRRISASVNDLFMEEKQNLYVDELGEVYKWCMVLEGTDVYLATKEFGLLQQWLVAGMDEIRKMVEMPEGEDDYPLGPTYHPDMLLLFVRVVSMACVLTDPAADSGQVSTMATKLAGLNRVCEEKNVHERLLDAFRMKGSIDDEDWRHLLDDMI